MAVQLAIAAASFMAQGLYEHLTKDRPTTVSYGYNGQEYDSYEAMMEAWEVDHAPIPSGEQRRLVEGRSTRISSMKQALPPRRKIYGTIDLGAAYYLHEVVSPYLYTGYLLGDGPIAGVSHVSIGGKKWGITGNHITDPSLYTVGLLKLGVGTGEDDQETDSILAATTGISPIAKPATYRQRGIARITCRLHYADNSNPKYGSNSEHHSALWSGSTAFTYTVQGSIIDNLEGATEHTDNPAIQLYDYLVGVDWPGQMPDSEVDLQSFVDAKSACVAAGFAAHGVVYSDDSASKSISGILATCDASLIRPNGKYELIIDSQASPALTLTDDDFISSVAYSPDAALDDAPNVIRVTYGGGVGEVIVKDDDRLVNDVERQKSISLDMITDADIAEKLALRMLKKLNRPVITTTINDVGLLLTVLDVVTIDSAAFSDINGQYKILSLEPDTVGVGVVLREYIADDYS